LFSGVILALFLPSSIDSQTWYVRNDGTGDAPTIQAAVDSAAAGDTILVGPGTYSNALPVIIENKDSLTVVSESGPERTFLNSIILNSANYTTVSGFTFANGYHGMGLSWSHQLLIENNIVRNATETGISAKVVSKAIIRNNLIYGCGGIGMIIGDAAGDIEVRYNTISHCGLCGISTDADPIIIANNLVANNAIGIQAYNPIYYLLCNDVCGNTTNYDLFGMSDPTGTNGNISVDPRFCGVEPAVSGNYYLQSVSPCAPGNHPDGYACGLIGARPVYCGSTSTDQTTWGRIKAMYQGQPKKEGRR
jgi:hypothetical protein